MKPKVCGPYPLAERGAKRRRHRGEARCGLLPVEPVRGGHFVGEAREPRLVRQHLRQRDVFLAVRREIRPEIRDRRVVVEPPLAHRAGDKEGDDELAARIEAGQRIVRPRMLTLAVGEAANQVDDAGAFDEDRKTRAEFKAFGEVLRESVPHPGEGGIGET